MVNTGIERQRASLLIELLVAMALLTGVLLPLAYSFASERRYARAAYQRAAAIEIVDGEIEVLASGEWRAYRKGAQDYRVNAGAATNLPPGKFLLTIGDHKVRLEWAALPRAGRIGRVVREVTVK
jgi:hypothetical protein